MSAAIQVQISNEATTAVVHRFRNFGEDVLRALREAGTFAIEEVDVASTGFTVRNIRHRDLGEVTQTLKRELKRHHLEQAVTLTRL